MNQTIDVIIPVYRGLQDVIDCLDSVKTSDNNSTYELIVIDDCSPEPAVSQLLKDRAALGEFTLLVNKENLGFVATVNRGMQLHPERDVLLLNSDTLVANDWLDRIAKAAYADTKIGTVTPFSNNATICSYPTFCQDNALPSNTPLSRLDLLFSITNKGEAVDIPTGVGFCMYIRRACLNEIGYFDVETFGKGYGEENDFCQRAVKAGWKNRFALDTFVQHTGNVSFGDEHNELKHGALAKLIKHHPQYERDVHLHIAEDPAKISRVKTWLASLVAGTQPIIVHVSHSRGGGTLRFVEELSQEIEEQAYSLLLMPSVNKPGHLVLTKISLSQDGSSPLETEYSIYFNDQLQQSLLIDTLKKLPIVGFHFHHMIDVPTWVMDIPEQLGKPWVVSLHDYYYMCKSISLTDSDERFIGYNKITTDKEWQNSFSSFLDKASTCIAPSNACRSLYKNTFPNANIITIYHERGRHSKLDSYPVQPLKPSSSTPLKVIVIGALSKMKGADLLEEVAKLARKHDTNVEFELIGYGYRELCTTSDSKLSIYGRYKEKELASILQSRKADNNVLVWFTALWPETYSYTLSSALEAGLPVLVPNIGAFEERVYDRPNSWVIPWDSSASSILTLLETLSNEGSQAHKLKGLTSHVEPAKQSYSYQDNYFTLLKTPPMNHLSSTKIEAEDIVNWVHQVLPLMDSSISLNTSLRKTILRGLLYLRSAPVFRTLVKLIPSALQHRIKKTLSS